MDDLTAGIAKYSIFFSKPLLELICYIVMIVLTIKILMIIYRIASERLQNSNEAEADKPEEVGVEVDIEFGANNNREENNFDEDMHSSNNHHQCENGDGDKEPGLVNIVRLNFNQNNPDGDNVKHGESSDDDLVHSNDDYDNVNENPGIGDPTLLNSVNINLNSFNVYHSNIVVDNPDHNKLPGDDDSAYKNGNNENFSENPGLNDPVLLNEAETEKPEEVGVEVDIEFEANNNRDVNNFGDGMHSSNNHYQCDIYNDGNKEPGLVNIVRLKFAENNLDGDNVKHAGSSDNDLLNSVKISLSSSNVYHSNIGVDNPAYNGKLPGDDDSAYNNGNDDKFSENPDFNDPVLLNSVQRSVCEDSLCDIIVAVDEPTDKHGEHNCIQLNSTHICLDGDINNNVSRGNDIASKNAVHENIDQKTTTNSNRYDTGYLNFIFENAYQNSLNSAHFKMAPPHHVSLEHNIFDDLVTSDDANVDHDTLVYDEFDDYVASDSDEIEDDSAG